MPDKLRLRSLTRLVIGSAIRGLDILAENMDAWEKQAEMGPPIENLAGELDRLAETPAQIPPSLPEVSGLTEPRPLPSQQALTGEIIVPDASEPAAESLGYAFAGLLFASQDRLENYLDMADRATRVAGNWADLLGGPIYRSRVMGPFRRSLDGLSDHGQHVVNRWITVGRTEADTSRRMANNAITDQVDTVIDYLTANEEVQELIQSQSVGLVDEVIEETRERTVSADNFLEAVVRSVLRRPPRWELPAPPQELQKKAEQDTRQYHGRLIRK